MKKTKLNLVFMLLVAAFSQSVAQTTGEIRGKITDDKTKSPVEFATVVAFINDKQIAGAMSDENGYYSIKPLAAGQYTIKTSLLGYNSSTLNKVEVNAQTMTRVNLALQSNEYIIDGGTIDEYVIPLINPSGSGLVITDKDMENMPYTSAIDIAATSAGVIQSDSEEGLNIRGSRKDGTQYIIDGVKVMGSVHLPKGAIKEIKVLTGGIPAMFGDATGGIIIITTKSFAMW